MINPVFDRGYFQSIQVVTISGEVVARKELPVAQGGVPAWFVELFPLRAPSRESIISAGWNELGRVSVVSHPHFAYLQLWHTGIETLSWLAAAFILALLGLRVFLAGILRPLRAIEGAAVAIGERDFRTIAFVPAARELRSKEVSEPARGSQHWRRAIESALESNRFSLYAQPVMALPGRTLLHQEVMARLLDENGSVVPAAQFLPMAARHGLMPRLDLAMIRKLIARIGSDKESRARISLNIAAQTIADQDATRQLFDLLLANPQLASRLVFEMTEFGAVRDAAVTRAFASKLRSLGSGFALDNFGLHRDGLSALPALLPAYVKLAAEFTRRMVDDVGTRFLITSLSRIAQPLEIMLIAQAVEQESILRGLEELGVGGYQGYISGKPAPFGVED